MSKNSSDSRFLQIDHDEIQHMHLFNSASFNTNNDNNNVNEARNENVYNLRQVGGASVNQPSDKNIPDVYRILLQNQLLMQNLLHNQTVSVPNTNSKRSATASCTVSKETEVRQKRQKIDDRHANRDHVKPALADNYSKELDKLFGTDSECENDYSDISSECDSDFSVQDEDNLEQVGVTENTKPKQGETRNADHDENSSVIELMREFIATEEKGGPNINNDLASVVNNGLRKRANEDKLKELSKKYTKPENVTSLTAPRINVGELDIM
jgi:hypothetical protein